MPQYPKAPNDFPSGEIYALLVPEITHVPGDERSRTSPGHGYPAHNVHNWSIVIYNTKEEWIEEIKRRKGLVFPDKGFVPVVMKVANVRTRFEVEVDDGA